MNHNIIVFSQFSWACQLILSYHLFIIISILIVDALRWCNILLVIVRPSRTTFVSDLGNECLAVPGGSASARLAITNADHVCIAGVNSSCGCHGRSLSCSWCEGVAILWRYNGDTPGKLECEFDSPSFEYMQWMITVLKVHWACGSCLDTSVECC